MAIIKIKRGPTVPTGLTAGELAFDYTNGNLFIGATGSTISRIAGTSFVSTFNGLSGAVTGVTTGTTNTFTALQTFNAGITSAGATFTTAISGTTATFTSAVLSNLYRPTSAGAGLTIGQLSGGGQGNISILASELRIGGASTLLGLTLSTTTGVTLTVGPQHNLIVNPIGTATLAPRFSGAGSGGSIPSLLIQNSDSGSGEVRVAGGNLYLGTRTDGVLNYSSDIIFGNPNNAFTTTITAPNTATSSKTITTPNITGNMVVDANTNTFTALQTFNSGLTASSGSFPSGISAGGFILTSAGIKALTGTTYTFLEADNGDVLTHDNASGCTFTVPTGLPVGYSTTVIRLNASGRVGFVAAAGVTMNTYGGFTAIAGQHASASLISYASNIYNLSGNLL